MTTFIHRQGMYKSEMMLFGVMNAFSIFQGMMDSILGRGAFAGVYTGDVVILL